MAKDVVDLPKAVEIDIDHGEILAAFCSALDRKLELSRKRGTVRQLRQPVMVGEIFDARLSAPAVGHVLDDVDEILRRAVAVSDRYLFIRDQPGSIARRFKWMIVDEYFCTGRQQLVVTLCDDVRLRLAEHFMRGLADHLFTRQAEEILARAVDQYVTAVGPRFYHPRRGDVI